MVAITSYGALKLNQALCMLFAVGMNFFPQKFMEGYNADVFDGKADIIMQFCMGIVSAPACRAIPAAAARARAHPQRPHGLARPRSSA